MQSKLSITLNNIVRFLCIYFIAFVWINYYYPKFLPSVIIASIIASIIIIFIAIQNNKKYEKTKHSKDEERKILELCLNLQHLKTKELIDYFYLTIQKKYENTKKTKDYIIVKDTTIVPIFNNLLTIEDYLQAYKLKTSEHLCILTDNIDTNLNEYLKNIESTNTKILTINEIYNLFFKESQIPLVNNITLKKQSKLKLNQLIAIAFNKKNSKNYFWSGVFVMITSFFYGYGIYYQIVATILFLFSLFSLVNKKYNTTTKNDIFK